MKRNNASSTRYSRLCSFFQSIQALAFTRRAPLLLLLHTIGKQANKQPRLISRHSHSCCPILCDVKSLQAMDVDQYSSCKVDQVECKQDGDGCLAIALRVKSEKHITINNECFRSTGRERGTLLKNDEYEQ
jgi:hypothetical protein